MRSTLARASIAVLLGLPACGNDGKDGTLNHDAGNTGPDAKEFRDAPPTMTVQVTVSGQATERTVNGAAPMADVLIVAFRNADETTPIAMTTTDGFGNFSLTIETMGESIDGFLKATKLGFKTTYLYPPYPLMMDFDMATVIMVTPQNYDNLSTLAQGNQQPGNGLIGLIVTDGTSPVGGATVTSNPTGTVKYNATSGSLVFPSATAMSTHTDGVAYIFNAPAGEITVSATHPSMTFSSHGLKAWPDELTTTVIVP